MINPNICKNLNISGLIMKKTVSFLSSTIGSNFTAVAKKIISGKINARPGIVITDEKNAKVLPRAKAMGIEAFFINPDDFSSRENYEKELVALLKKHSTDLVVTAGFMRLLTPYFISKFRNKIINIHPALLPSFPGLKAQKQALDYGVKITGCTSHFIDEGTDTGPIILQAAVPILDSDTQTSISKKILIEEHKILSESVKLFCDNRLKVKGRKVLIKN